MLIDEVFDHRYLHLYVFGIVGLFSSDARFSSDLGGGSLGETSDEAVDRVDG
jgi:hypothetical protein